MVAPIYVNRKKYLKKRISISFIYGRDSYFIKETEWVFFIYERDRYPLCTKKSGVVLT
jgi:hypothetical protein